MLSEKKQTLKFEEPDYVPYAGIKGQWIPTYNFQSKGKSFGHFQCNYCSKVWMSAHAKKKFKQACKDCSRYFYPAFMWQNVYQKKEFQNKKQLNDNKKPHRKDLCEACKLGKCDY